MYLCVCMCMCNFLCSFQLYVYFEDNWSSNLELLVWFFYDIILYLYLFL